MTRFAGVTIRGLLAFSVLLLLSALPAGAAVRQGVVTLEIWSPENRAENVQAHEWLFQEFEKANPNIRMKLTITSWTDHNTRIAAANAAGNLPDIMYSWQPNTLAFEQQGLLADVSDVMSRVGVKQFPSFQIEFLKYKNKHYVVPFMSVPHAFWYRKDWFQQAGIARPQTWKQIRQAAEKLTSGDRFGICLFNKDLDSYYIIDRMIATGSEPFDKSGRVAINSPGIVRALAWIKAINGNKWTAPGWTAWNMDDAKLPFMAEKCAMKLDSTSFVNTLRNQTPELLAKVGAFPIPRDGSEYAGLAGMSGYSITVQSPHRREAKQFLEFLHRPNIYANFMAREVLGFIPVNSKVTLGKGFYRAPRIAPFVEVYKAGWQALNRGRSMPVYAATAAAAGKAYNEGLYAQMGERIYAGQSPKAVAAWAARRLEEIKRSG